VYVASLRGIFFTCVCGEWWCAKDERRDNGKGLPKRFPEHVVLLLPLLVTPVAVQVVRSHDVIEALRRVQKATL
jgi:hypothetical protein